MFNYRITIFKICNEHHPCHQFLPSVYWSSRWLAHGCLSLNCRTSRWTSRLLAPVAQRDPFGWIKYQVAPLRTTPERSHLSTTQELAAGVYSLLLNLILNKQDQEHNLMVKGLTCVQEDFLLVDHVQRLILRVLRVLSLSLRATF